MLQLSLRSLSLAFQETTNAAPTEGGGSGGSSFLVPMLLVLGIFYLVLFLPERKKQKARKDMLGALKKGDKVMTNSGMYGAVTQIKDDIVTLQVADGVRLRFNRAAIQDVLGDPSPETKDEKEAKDSVDAKQVEAGA